MPEPKVAKTGDTIKVMEGPLKGLYFEVKKRRTSTTIEVSAKGKSCILQDKDIKVVW